MHTCDVWYELLMTLLRIVFMGKVKGHRDRSRVTVSSCQRDTRRRSRHWQLLPLLQLNLPGESRRYVVHIVGTEHGGGVEHLRAATHGWSCVHVTAIYTIWTDNDGCPGCRFRSNTQLASSRRVRRDRTVEYPPFLLIFLQRTGAALRHAFWQRQTFTMDRVIHASDHVPSVCTARDWEPSWTELSGLSRTTCHSDSIARNMRRATSPGALHPARRRRDQSAFDLKKEKVRAQSAKSAKITTITTPT